MTNERPKADSRQAPPSASTTVRLQPDATCDVSPAVVGSGFSRTSVSGAAAGLTMARRRSLRVETSMSGRELVRQQHVEDPKGRRLRERSCVPDRPNATRTPVLAVALG